MGCFSFCFDVSGFERRTEPSGEGGGGQTDEVATEESRGRIQVPE